MSVGPAFAEVEPRIDRGVSLDVASDVAPTAVSQSAKAARGLELPRLIVRRVWIVAAASVLLIGATGLWAARLDAEREMGSSLAVARVLSIVSKMRTGPTDELLARLRRLDGLRHVDFELRDEAGRSIVRVGADPADSASSTFGRSWRQLVAPEAGGRAKPTLAQAVVLPDGRTWTATFIASPDSELAEAAANLAWLMTMIVATCVAVAASALFVVQRAFRPLQQLVEAIGGVERGELQAVRALPRMPARELETIAQALRHLAEGLERAADARRVLASRLLSLQEDERQRLARELHDELGQRLTALRVDARWLQGALAEDESARHVVDGMADQVARLQEDVRHLLAQLRPPGLPGPTGAEGSGGELTLGRLRSMLDELVGGWSAGPRRGATEVRLMFEPDDAGMPIPGELGLGLYRITQEALTNVMRHAGATRCEVRIEAAPDDLAPAALQWSVSDDGGGLGDLDAACRRGTGLAGIRERVALLGGQLQARTGLDGRGLGLAAALRVPV